MRYLSLCAWLISLNVLQLRQLPQIPRLHSFTWPSNILLHFCTAGASIGRCPKPEPVGHQLKPGPQQSVFLLFHKRFGHSCREMPNTGWVGIAEVGGCILEILLVSVAQCREDNLQQFNVHFRKNRERGILRPLAQRILAGHRDGSRRDVVLLPHSIYTTMACSINMCGY